MALASASAAVGGGPGPLLEEQRVIMQRTREHRPGAEAPVAADGGAVVPVRRGEVTVQRGQPRQVVVRRTGAHDRPGGDDGPSGVGGQGPVDPRCVLRRLQQHAAAGDLGQRPGVEHVRAQQVQPGPGEFVQPAARLLGAAVRGVELDQRGGVPRPEVRAGHQVAQLALHPLLVVVGQAGVQPDRVQLAPVNRAGVGQAGRLPGLEGLPGEIGGGPEVAGQRGQRGSPRPGGQPGRGLTEHIGQPAEPGQDPLRGRAVAGFEQVRQPHHAAVQLGLGQPGLLGRSDDLVRRGERVPGILRPPQDVMPGQQRGGQSCRGALAAVGVRAVRIAGDRLAGLPDGLLGGGPGRVQIGRERHRQPRQRAGAQRVIAGVQRRGGLAEQRRHGVRGGVEIEVPRVQQGRGGQQPWLTGVPGELHRFVQGTGGLRVGTGCGQRLGQAQQELAPAGRSGLRGPLLHIQGAAEVAGRLLPGQHGQRVLAGQPGVAHRPARRLAAGRHRPQEVVGELGVAPPARAGWHRAGWHRAGWHRAGRRRAGQLRV
jgi:hypothetical protein